MDIINDNLQSILLDYEKNKNKERLLNLLEAQVVMLRSDLAKNSPQKHIYRGCEQALDMHLLNWEEDEKHIQIVLDAVLPGRTIHSNKYIKDIVYDAISKNRREYNPYGERNMIEINEFRHQTKTGKCNKDSDNIDIKGIIDGITNAMYIDDNGDLVAFTVRINKIPREKKECTAITVRKDTAKVEYFNPKS